MERLERFVADPGILDLVRQYLRMSGLDPAMARNLRRLFQGVGMDPERAGEMLGKLRRGFIVPVPGLLADTEPDVEVLEDLLEVPDGD